MKVQIRRNVKFDEEGMQENNPKDGANVLGDSSQVEFKDHFSPYSPISFSSPSLSTSSNGVDEPLVSKSRRFCELYEATDELHLICLLADYEPLVYNVTVKEEK